jgi:hypothetical protein
VRVSILGEGIGWIYCNGHSPRQEEWSGVPDRGFGADADGYRLPLGRDGVG